MRLHHHRFSIPPLLVLTAAAVAVVAIGCGQTGGAAQAGQDDSQVESVAPSIQYGTLDRRRPSGLPVSDNPPAPEEEKEERVTPSCLILTPAKAFTPINLQHLFTARVMGPHCREPVEDTLVEVFIDGVGTLLTLNGGQVESLQGRHGVVRTDSNGEIQGVVTSREAGTSVILAYVPDIDDDLGQKALAWNAWVNVLLTWSGPQREVVTALAGQDYPITVKAVRVTSPTSRRYLLRCRILYGDANVHLRPSFGNEALISTDREGQATCTVQQWRALFGEARVRAELIDASSDAVLGQREYSIRWNNPVGPEVDAL